MVELTLPPLRAILLLPLVCSNFMSCSAKVDNFSLSCFLIGFYVVPCHSKSCSSSGA